MSTRYNLSGTVYIEVQRACTLKSGDPCNGCVALAEIGRQTRKASGVVSDMVSRRHEALIKLNEDHDPFFRHFPIEISGQIFLDCLPETSPPYGLPADYDMEPKRLPTLKTLMSICKNWRELVCSTPALWKTLFAHRPEHIRNIDRYLARSGGLPLTIDVDLYEKYWTLAQGHQMMKAICRHTSRWQTVTVRAPLAVIASITDHTITLKDGVPNLKYIRLTGLQNYFGGGPSTYTLAFGNQNASAASPTEIIMRNVIVSRTTFDLRCLTFLTLDDTPINHLEDILFNSPLLRAVSAKVYGSGARRRQSLTDQAVTRSPFIHSSLKHLDLTIYDTGDDNFFDAITLPSMIALKCRSLHPNQRDQYRGLYDLFLRSRSPLESLNLSLYCTEEQLLRLLLLTSSLRELTIDEIILTGLFFNCLGGTALPPSTKVQTTFLPKLGAIRFGADQVYHQPFDVSLLRTMIRDPSPTEASFSRVLLDITVVWDKHYGRLSESDELIIWDLLNQGIEISLPVDGSDSEDIIEKYARLRNARAKLREENVQFAATGRISL
ncbi:hypothetical protein CPB83DRAFT_855051 [Crepidotus variabilis]|uniref:F-box domain-containing protein n=1 Tax=Crepidotus variabilis TaxID=179855 RepID=A0A9P6EFY9_9AGAR|nr:hypothetical protein CPB83DRAFT_855051 [Crepidotus variabilis]